MTQCSEDFARSSDVDLTGYDQFDDVAVWIADPHLTGSAILDDLEVVRTQMRERFIVVCDREGRVTSERVEGWGRTAHLCTRGRLDEMNFAVTGGVPDAPDRTHVRPGNRAKPEYTFVELASAFEVTDRKGHMMSGYLDSHGISFFALTAIATILVHHT